MVTKIFTIVAAILIIYAVGSTITKFKKGETTFFKFFFSLILWTILVVIGWNVACNISMIVNQPDYYGTKELGQITYYFDSNEMMFNNTIVSSDAGNPPMRTEQGSVYPFVKSFKTIITVNDGSDFYVACFVGKNGSGLEFVDVYHVKTVFGGIVLLTHEERFDRTNDDYLTVQGKLLGDYNFDYEHINAIPGMSNWATGR